MDDEAAAAAGPAAEPGDQDRGPYAAPRLTSYGSLPVDTAGHSPPFSGPDFIGYLS
jgi:hypothetical protein